MRGGSCPGEGMSCRSCAEPEDGGSQEQGSAVAGPSFGRRRSASPVEGWEHASSAARCALSRCRWAGLRRPDDRLRARLLRAAPGRRRGRRRRSGRRPRHRAVALAALTPPGPVGLLPARAEGPGGITSGAPPPGDHLPARPARWRPYRGHHRAHQPRPGPPVPAVTTGQHLRSCVPQPRRRGPEEQRQRRGWWCRPAVLAGGWGRSGISVVGAGRAAPRCGCE